MKDVDKWNESRMRQQSFSLPWKIFPVASICNDLLIGIYYNGGKICSLLNITLRTEIKWKPIDIFT